MARLITAFAVGLGIGGALIAAVFATGATFGQRCERLHPNADASTIERCVDAMSHR